MATWWALTLGVALAQDADAVLNWSYEEYDAGNSVVGDDGWERGYSEDRWRASGTGEYVMSTSDENGGSFGSEEAADNWLVNSKVNVENGMVVASFYTEDDDT
ncbi:MAG: hypothetical protein QGG40_09225, partial [Myxococcota bacterium]|nr:hypothetical protein [Myxococcota bacterium]